MVSGAEESTARHGKVRDGIRIAVLLHKGKVRRSAENSTSGQRRATLGIT